MKLHWKKMLQQKSQVYQAKLLVKGLGINHSLSPFLGFSSACTTWGLYGAAVLVSTRCTVTGSSLRHMPASGTGLQLWLCWIWLCIDFSSKSNTYPKDGLSKDHVFSKELQILELGCLCSFLRPSLWGSWLKQMLLSGARPKSKAALFEFSKVRQGFTIINNHMVPGNGLLFCTGEGQCLLALCSSAAGMQHAKASHKQGRFLDVAPTNACLVAKARAVRDGATSLVLLAQMPVQDQPGGSLPAGETRLLLCKQNLPLDFGRPKKVVYEKFPRLHVEVRLSVYVQQSLETHSSPLPAVGYFLRLLVSPFAKARLNLGGCATGWVKEANTKERAVFPGEWGTLHCFYNETNTKRKNEMIIS